VEAFRSIGQAISTNERSEIFMAEHANKPEATEPKPQLLPDPAASGSNKLLIEPTSMEARDIEALEPQTTVALQQNGIRTEHNPGMTAGNKLTKKRKNISLRPVDDGGEYKPSADSESESESDEVQAQLPIPKRKLGRSRKLQKTDLQEVVGGKKTELNAADSLTNKKEITLPTAGSELPTNPTQLTSRSVLIKAGSSSRASRTPRNGLQPAFPASSLIAGNAGTNTSTAMAKNSFQESTSMACDAGPSDDNVPPVPRLPRTVRLASGEIINLEASRKLTDQHTETIAGPKDAGDENRLEDSQSERGTIQSKKSFEWPADVF
jgi:hypothetical protein